MLYDEIELLKQYQELEYTFSKTIDKNERTQISKRLDKLSDLIDNLELAL